MSWKNLSKKKILQIVKQFTGKFDEIKGELAPVALIKGKGDIWCYHITKQRHIKLYRGTRVVIIDNEQDELGRVLVLTQSKDLVAIHPDDLIEIGFN